MENIRLIVTHPGGAHKDDFLACSLLLNFWPVTVLRRDPTDEELEDPTVCVVDIGHRHEPAKMNFDHHQFSNEHPPTCSLSLALQHLKLYEDAKQFCAWLEPAEFFDCLGGRETARRIGAPPEVPSSREGNSVVPPTAWAATWSTEMPFWMSSGLSVCSTVSQVSMLPVPRA